MLHALGTVYIAEVLKNVAHLFALAGLGVKWAKLIKERTGIGIFLDTSAGYLDVKLKTGKVPILVENCPEVLLDKGLWEECAEAKPSTKKRYGLFLCWDEEPQPGEDATLLLAGRLRHRHCESVDVAVAAYPFNVDAEALAPAPAPVAGARTRGRTAEQAVVDAAAEARAAAATLDLPPEHVRLLLKSILDTDAVDRTLRAYIADVGSTHPEFDYHATALKRYWRSRVTLGMARNMKLGIARLDGQIGSDEQLISHTEDLIRRARAKLGPI